MRNLRTAFAAAIVLAACPLVAAPQESPVSDALRADLMRYEKNIVGAAETMPADKFMTKPTSQQKTFAELMEHLVGGNYMLCGWIAGQQPPARAASSSPGKDELVKSLKASFAYCRSELAKVDDSRLGEEVPFFGGGKVTRAAAMLDLAADWGDHYSLAATELRLAGQLPPSARADAQGK